MSLWLSLVSLSHAGCGPAGCLPADPSQAVHTGSSTPEQQIEARIATFALG